MNRLQIAGLHRQVKGVIGPSQQAHVTVAFLAVERDDQAADLNFLVIDFRSQRRDLELQRDRFALRLAELRLRERLFGLQLRQASVEFLDLRVQRRFSSREASQLTLERIGPRGLRVAGRLRRPQIALQLLELLGSGLRRAEDRQQRQTDHRDDRKKSFHALLSPALSILERPNLDRLKLESNLARYTRYICDPKF